VVQSATIYADAAIKITEAREDVEDAVHALNDAQERGRGPQ
jgi:hypothetical protein